MEGGVAELGFAGQVDQLPRLGHRNGQGFFAEHVLAGLEGGLDDGEVHEIGRADVDRVHRGVFQDLAIVRLGLLHPELGGE